MAKEVESLPNKCEALSIPVPPKKIGSVVSKNSVLSPELIKPHWEFHLGPALWQGHPHWTIELENTFLGEQPKES
jgi:hypothetical protein